MASYSGLYDGVFGQPYALLASANSGSNDMTMLTRLFARRGYGRAATRGLLRALNGVAPGATASESRVRVQSRASTDGNLQGGAIPVETFSAINRATTAADVTRIATALTALSGLSTYPRDLSGNGGGGKLS